LVANYDENTNVNDNPNYQNVKLDWITSETDDGSDIISYTIQYSLDLSFETNVFSLTNSFNIETHSSDLIIPYASRTTSTGWYYFKVCSNTDLGNGLYTLPSTIMTESYSYCYTKFNL